MIHAVVALVALLVLPPSVVAQPVGKIPRLGYLWLKTAKGLGLTISQSVLLRADEVLP